MFTQHTTQTESVIRAPDILKKDIISELVDDVPSSSFSLGSDAMRVLLLDNLAGTDLGI
jgi:hypothetical protein